MQFQNGECDVLVCTDIASRGLDTVRVSFVKFLSTNTDSLQLAVTIFWTVLLSLWKYWACAYASKSFMAVSEQFRVQ